MGCRPVLARRGRSALSAAVVAAGLCLAATMLVPVALGLERYVITGDSMSGSYDRGSIVYADEVPVDELAVGDVITYTPPARAGVDGMVTHRIVSIAADRRGRPVFRTKGDANPARDPWRFTLERSVQARARFAIPYVGYAYAALSIREVRMAVIGAPALVIAAALLAGLWRQAGRDARGDPDPSGAEA